MTATRGSKAGRCSRRMPIRSERGVRTHRPRARRTRGSRRTPRLATLVGRNSLYNPSRNTVSNPRNVGLLARISRLTRTQCSRCDSRGGGCSRVRARRTRVRFHALNARPGSDYYDSCRNRGAGRSRARTSRRTRTRCSRHGHRATSGGFARRPRQRASRCRNGTDSASLHTGTDDLRTKFIDR